MLTYIKTNTMTTTPIVIITSNTTPTATPTVVPVDEEELSVADGVLVEELVDPLTK